ncbi:MAG: RMD1 family protein [Candidatus Eremiobacteraeota bacterium]|nr:RMD1 family protein [Candidatus Eremiobacteraeota bacterium]
MPSRAQDETAIRAESQAISHVLVKKLSIPPGRYRLESYHLGASIDLKKLARGLEGTLGPARTHAIFERPGVVVWVFPFGSVVILFREAGGQVDPILTEVAPYVEDKDEVVNDNYEVEIGGDDRVEFGRVTLSSPDKLGVVTLMLAQSTSLEHYEQLADELMSKAAHITDAMAEGKPPSATAREMLRFIGMGLAARRELVGHLSILDPPEATWEDLQIERLYESLRVNFDLQSRFRSLEYKLGLVKETAQVVIDLSESRRFTILEVIIILLIAVEILLYLPAFLK